MALRLDRLITLHFVSPLHRLRLRVQPAIPILMYHSIAEANESKTHAYYRTATSPATFASQMEHLHSRGYRTCTVAQVRTLLESDPEFAARTVAITFDDGYRDFHLNAFPVLQKYGFTATMFLPTAFIGDTMLQFKGRDCLTWSEVRELQQSGVLFGSHTMTHPQLRDLDSASVEREITNSKSSIEQKTGSAVSTFAYPYAFPQRDAEFKKRLRVSLSRAGYLSGVCTTLGRATSHSDQFFMERLPVNSLDDSALFHAKLSGAYDWMAKPQSVLKAAKIWKSSGARSHNGATTPPEPAEPPTANSRETDKTQV